MPQALELFGKSQPGRFFAGPTLALDVGGSTAWLAGHANPDELASFLHFCGCKAVILDEAECPPPTGWARVKSHFVFGWCRKAAAGTRCGRNALGLPAF